MAKRVKAKTNRSAAKRFHFTASGKLKRKKAGLRHFMRRRPTKAKRNLRQRGYVDSTNMPRVLALLPNR
jgi:large subunit ribosomal protein L35